MGIRQDQVMGLNSRAQKLIKGEDSILYTEYITRRYPNGHTETLPAHAIYGSSTKSEEIDCFNGMYTSTHPLYKHSLPNGTDYYEAIQEEVWSSGPMFFIALKDQSRKWVEESLWTEEEIKSAT